MKFGGRFSANAARDFLGRYGIGESEIEQVWDAIALHTTPGIPQYKKPVVALVTAGVEMDVLGLAYDRQRCARSDGRCAARRSRAHDRCGAP